MSQDLILEAEGVCKHFGRLQVLHGVGLQLRRGEALGVVGPNGAGKTTLFGVLAGTLPSSSGSVQFDGQNIDAWELPCHHTFKIMGEMQYPLAQVVSDIAVRICPGFDASRITMRPSSGGKYLSVTVEVYLETREQINALYAAFNAAPEIKLVY